MQNITRLAVVMTFALSSLAFAFQTAASPGFDLDLKDLKKPSSPPAVAKKSTTATSQKKPSAAVRQVTATQPPKRQTALKPKTAPAVTPAAATASVDPVPSELTLVGGDACRLAERMAVAVARSAPAEQLLFSLNLKPVAAVQYNNLSLLISCGISAAEAYTYGRLLEEHQVQLVNISGNESVGQVARSIIDALALSYQLTGDRSGSGTALVYLFPADNERKRPLRLIIQP